MMQTEVGEIDTRHVARGSLRGAPKRQSTSEMGRETRRCACFRPVSRHCALLQWATKSDVPKLESPAAQRAGNCGGRQISSTSAYQRSSERWPFRLA